MNHKVWVELPSPACFKVKCTCGWRGVPTWKPWIALGQAEVHEKGPTDPMMTEDDWYTRWCEKGYPYQ